MQPIKNALILCLFAISGMLSAQHYVQKIQLLNGSINEHNVSQIDSMTFESGNALIYLSSGNNDTLSISAIDSGYFEINQRVHSCGADNIHNASVDYGSVADQEGNVYKTTTIGLRIWMAENLNTALFQNGDSIDSGNTYYYNFDSSYACPYGRMYDGTAVTDARNVCPVGWHVPSYQEWIGTLQTLNPNYNPADPTNTDGIALKSSGTIEDGNGWWLSPNTGSNSTGFSALPGGYYDSWMFNNLNLEGAIWSSSSSSGMITAFSFGSENILPIASYFNYGYSVRCISDTLTNGLLPGCTNPDACNYNSAATFDDGSCIITGSTCNDNLGGTINDVYASDCSCSGVAPLATPHSCGEESVHNPEVNYGTMTDQEGHIYKTVVIGNQKWMAENLNTASFRNGDAIPAYVAATTQEQIYQDIASFTPWYDFDFNNPDYECPYGKLYNWYAVSDTRHVCPAGWHEPNVNEWSELVNTIDPAADGGLAPNNAGIAMRSTGTFEAGSGLWFDDPANVATNSSGFSALPSGGAYSSNYDSDHFMAEFWTRSLSENNSPICYQTFSNIINVFQGTYSFYPNPSIITQSVRCINDTLVSGIVQIPGCTDVAACNYDILATQDDGSCRVTGAPCSDLLSGTFNDVWDENCICRGEILTFDPHSCGSASVHNPELTYGSLTDQEGNTYKTIVIGTQEWMAENLNTGIYSNGDTISTVSTNDGTGMWSYYFDSIDYSCPYGKLYNWYAVADSRNVCPVGWHVPSNDDWSTLINFVDPTADGGQNFNNVASGALRSAGTIELANGYFHEPNDASNSSGFSGLPGGLFNTDENSYFNLNYYGIWWSANATDEFTAGIKALSQEQPIILDNFPKTYRTAIRCVRD